MLTAMTTLRSLPDSDLGYYQSEAFSHLVDSIGGALLFVKNSQSRIINGNQLMAEHCGFDSVDKLKEKSDFDIFPYELAIHYRQDDQEVFSSGNSKLNIVELFPNAVGQLQWIICNKTAILNAAGKTIGLIGVCQAFEHSQAYAKPFTSIARSIEFLQDNYTQKLSPQSLAALSGLSVRQFERRFKQLFKTSLHQYVLELRVLKACELLLSGQKPMTDIAVELGFYDQSAFSAAFKRKMGCTPLQYIKKRSLNS